MTIPLIPLPPYPNVPNVPGVPALPRNPNFPVSATAGTNVGNTTDIADTGDTSNTWGVYDENNNLAFVVDTYLEIKPDLSTKISDFPTEQGAFSSFNKVNTPDKVTVRVSLGVMGGDISPVKQLLDTLQDMLNSTDIFTVITPFSSYDGMNVVKVTYSHSSRKGVTRLEADISFEEVRSVQQSFTNVTLPAPVVKNPASAATTSNGKQQGAKTSVLSSGVNAASNWFKK